MWKPFGKRDDQKENIKIDHPRENPETAHGPFHKKPETAHGPFQKKR